MINRAEQNWPDDGQVKIEFLDNEFLTLLERVDRVMARVEALNLIEEFHDSLKRECARRWLYLADATDCLLGVRLLRHAWQHLSVGSPKFISKENIR